MVQGGHTAKIYYYDQQSSTMEIVNLLKDQPQIFANYDQFIADCNSNMLPEYSFIEPCYNDHSGVDGGQILASDQHPDHNVQEGENFIANIYNAIRKNPNLWQTTALLIVYDEHGGIYDHVPPPTCDPNFPDGHTASGDATGTGTPFSFDRLGVRVPAVLVSPWIPRGTIISGTEEPNPQKRRIFEHSSIPATITKFFLRDDVGNRTAREKNAQTFTDILTDTMRSDDDCVVFN
jgi:phospholipase C